MYSSLRTSETNYLNEAFSFYAAIRGRAYYSRAVREDRYELLRSVSNFLCFFSIVLALQLVSQMNMDGQNSEQQDNNYFIQFY